MLRRDRIRNLETHLSRREQDVFQEFMRQKSYESIAAATGYPTKSVDNALQRIRRKAEETPW
jgi:DNA-directed RNA polymerase specialized sigma24 family protein